MKPTTPGLGAWSWYSTEIFCGYYCPTGLIIRVTLIYLSIYSYLLKDFPLNFKSFYVTFKVRMNGRHGMPILLRYLLSQADSPETYMELEMYTLILLKTQSKVVFYSKACPGRKVEHF